MTLDKALAFLEQSYKLGRKLGLENIKRLLEKLENPQTKLQIVHVAGTNGKGSTSAMIYQSILEAGYSAGFYSSPHLVHYNERFQYNGKTIGDRDLAKTIGKVKLCCKELVEEGYDHPTEFEILTAVGLSYFDEIGLEYAVMEVGLGGRLDATNAVDEPAISVITPIGMDHLGYLGDDLLTIAREKAGIIKKHIPVISGLQEEAVMELLKEVAEERRAEFTTIDEESLEILRCDLSGNEFLYKGEEYKLALLGRHQIDNAILAIEALHLLREHNRIDIDEEEIKKGLHKVKWPGRLEKITSEPEVFIDGGHNAHGIRAVSQILKPEEKDRRVLLLGMRDDKDYGDVLDMLVPLFGRIFVTQPTGDGVVKVETLKEELVKRGMEAKGHADYKEAVGLALESLGEKDQLFIMGSFYLIGVAKDEVLSRLGVRR